MDAAPDGDGDLVALLGLGDAGPAALVFRQLTPGVFEDRAFPLGPDIAAGEPLGRSALLADIDGDGKLDRASAKSAGGLDLALLSKYRGLGTNQLDLFVDAKKVRFPLLLDIEGDGDLDIGATPFDLLNDSDFVWFPQTSSGNFDALGVPVGVSDGTDMNVGDFDGDGNIDGNWILDSLVVGQPDGIAVSLQQGDGAFGPTSLLLPGLCRYSLLEDLDGDGRDELLLEYKETQEEDYEYGVWTIQAGDSLAPANDSLADFATSSSPPVFNVDSFALGDMDGDGDLDIVSPLGLGSGNGWLLRVVPQIEPLLFGSPIEVSDGGQAGLERPTVALADMNRDGSLDIVAVEEGPMTLRVFEQNLDGSFVTAPPQMPYETTEDDLRYQLVFDVDANGLIDVGVSFEIDDPTQWQLQRAPGVFEIGTSPFNAASVYGDIDGDGDFDVFEAQEALTVNRIHFGAHQ